LFGEIDQILGGQLPQHAELASDIASDDDDEVRR